MAKTFGELIAEQDKLIKDIVVCLGPGTDPLEKAWNDMMEKHKKEKTEMSKQQYNAVQFLKGEIGYVNRDIGEHCGNCAHNARGPKKCYRWNPLNFEIGPYDTCKYFESNEEDED